MAKRKLDKRLRSVCGMLDWKGEQFGQWERHQSRKKNARKRAQFRAKGENRG